MQSNKQEIADHLERASAILDEAERAKRRLTNSERKSVEGHLERVEEVKEQEVLRNEIERMNAGGGVPGGGDFAQAVVSAGFNLKSNPSVTIPLRTALGKAPTLPAVGDWNRAAPEVVAMGRDARFLNANLVQESVGGESAIQDFRQSARTVTGSPQRALDATMDKATLDVTLALVTESLVQQAIIIESIPNEAFESIPSLRAFLNAEGVFQLNKALDSHAMSQIVAASPPFGQTGADLIAKLRNGISSMRADGASPSVAVLNPSDAASLDLSADAGGYVFATRDVGSSSPLWGLRVVERIGAGTESFIFAGPRDVGPLLSRNPSFRGRPLHGVQEEPLDSPARDQILVPCQERQGRAQGGGGMRYEVQDALVSYKDRLYSKGETLEATEEEMAGLLQAGYVKEVEAKKQSRKK